MNTISKLLRKHIKVHAKVQGCEEKTLYKCPYCNKVHLVIYHVPRTYVQGYKPDYCDKCGTKLNWRQM